MTEPESQQQTEPLYRGEDGARPSMAGELELERAERDLTERVLRSEVPERAKDAWAGETNADHVLAYFDDAQLRERKFNILNEEEFLLAMHPPAESVLQGDLRDEFGLEGPKYPLTPVAEHEFAEAREAAIARSSRSKGGFQLKKLFESVRELRRVDGNKDPEDKQSGGLLSGLLGGGGR